MGRLGIEPEHGQGPDVEVRGLREAPVPASHRDQEWTGGRSAGPAGSRSGCDRRPGSCSRRDRGGRLVMRFKARHVSSCI